jgi:hypothetical protein
MIDGLEPLTSRELNESTLCRWSAIRVSVSRDEHVNIHLPGNGVQGV